MSSKSKFRIFGLWGKSVREHLLKSSLPNKKMVSKKFALNEYQKPIVENMVSCPTSKTSFKY